jgi:hypothetical protein
MRSVVNPDSKSTKIATSDSLGSIQVHWESPRYWGRYGGVGRSSPAQHPLFPASPRQFPEPRFNSDKVEYTST